MSDHEIEAPLCDPDCVVRSGPMHHGQDYQCTGSAHFAGYHIRCTTPFHDRDLVPIFGTLPKDWPQ